MRLKNAGYTVYGAARRVDRMRALEKHGVEVVALDVTDEDSLRSAIDTIIRTSWPHRRARQQRRIRLLRRHRRRTAERGT
ncbi:MAG: hypothetical protein ACHP7F_00285 [Actinomycetales bacterium]|nr:hypothetical protein [Leifsonia sp.]